MKDNYLTFERDMNIHRQKVELLRLEQEQVESQLSEINQRSNRLSEIITELEMENLELLVGSATAETPYLKGGDEEIEYIIGQQKEEGVYRYHHYTNSDESKYEEVHKDSDVQNSKEQKSILDEM